MPRLTVPVLAVLALAAAPISAQRVAPAMTISAPISNVSYVVTFDSATAARRSLHVEMSFSTSTPGPVVLSLPAWTPGAYEVTWFARWVSNFAARSGSRDLPWDKLDYDTWRVRPASAGPVTVAFDFQADSLDNAMAWSRPDFAFFNGTNVFLYPEGRGFSWPATVTIKTSPGWGVATSMHPGASANTYQEKNYHDLVDMPFLVGRIDYDSMMVSGRMTRLATYPAGALSGDVRQAVWHDIQRAIPAEAAVTGETPWDHYTVMMVFDSIAGASALEHQSSHLGIYTYGIIGNPILASVTAHEIFHAWNVKRMRPAEMVPYRYDSPQPTPWLWVSEGITDYYADLALVRGGIISQDTFLLTTADKIAQVSQAPAVALEDASLSTWVHPTDGTGYIYYPKGSLAGFLLDILIRDASNNGSSLDRVMRDVYQGTYKRGRGFGATEWWGAVSKAAGGKAFASFNARYIDGREPFPYDSVLPLAGLRYVVDSIREPRLGINVGQDSAGVRVDGVVPGGPAEEAGLQPGDYLLAVGDVPINDPNAFALFRQKYGNQEGTEFPIQVRRNGQTMTLTGKVRLVARAEVRLERDPNASDKARRVLDGITTGR